MKSNEAYNRLVSHGLRPSVQRIAIMHYLLTHPTHPTVDEVYREMSEEIPTLSRTTVYNTLRLFSEKHAAQMITIDDHRVCYDGNTEPHVHFFCKGCGKIFDFFGEGAPKMPSPFMVDGNMVDEVQLYYKGYCSHCLAKKENEDCN